MPLVDAGFRDAGGHADHGRLLVYGPSLEVVVSALVESEDQPAARTVPALVDTGAAQSCIDSALATALNLPIVDVMTICGAGGARQHDVYAARITIPGLEFSQYGKFAGVELNAGGQEHAVLLGRTFLQHTLMIYDGYRAQITIGSARLPE